MKRNRKMNCLLTALAALLFGITLTPARFAQNSQKPTTAQPAAPQLFRLIEVRVKPEQVIAFMDFLKKETLPALKKGGAKQLLVWQANLGDGYLFTSAEPIASLSELDNVGALQKGLGEGYLAWVEKCGRLIVSIRTYVMVGLTDMWIVPKTPEVPKLGISVIASVTPNRDDEYLKNLKEAVAVAAKTNVKGVYISKVLFGGDFNDYRTFVMLDSYADIEKFFASFGKAATEAKHQPPATGIVRHSEWTVHRFLPELSIQPPVQKAEK
jgi:hypothetical protein